MDRVTIKLKDFPLTGFWMNVAEQRINYNGFYNCEIGGVKYKVVK